MAQEMGLFTPEEQAVVTSRLAAEDVLLDLAQETHISPAEAYHVLESHHSSPITAPTRISELARRPEVPLDSILAVLGISAADEAVAWADIELKYAGYLRKERLSAERLSQLDQFPLPDGLDYSGLQTLAFEARERLQRLQPRTLGQAGRIPGVSPSDLQNLLLELTRRQLFQRTARSFT
jgi:tRNA uridine 5-carboxymethylaminomethyl modification enzyme